MARLTVRILSRYLLRQHLAPLGFALAAFTLLMLLRQVAQQFGNLVGKGLPWSVIVEVFLLSLPFIVAMTLPMAVLVAVLYAFSQLAGDNEITAMKASGVGVGRLVAPVLSAAALVAALAFLWSDQVLPRSNHRLRTLLVDIQRKKPSFSLKEQVINEVVPGRLFLRAARVDPATNKLKDVTIYDLGDVERRRIISADSGHMAYTPGGRDLYLTLLDGDIREVNRSDPKQFDRTLYVVNKIRVENVANTLERTEHDTYRSDREMGICEMRMVVAAARREVQEAQWDTRGLIHNDLRRLAGLAPAHFDPLALSPADTAPSGFYCRALRQVAGWLVPAAASAAPPQVPDQGTRPRQGAPSRGRPEPPPPPPRPAQTTVPPSALLATGATVGEEQRVRAAQQRAASYEVEIQKKYAIAAASIVFALVGIPVALRFPRGGVGLVLATSLVVYTVYYVGLITGEELGDRLLVSPFVAMWAPNLLFSALGLMGLWVIRRPGDAPHGGDWTELFRAFLAWRRGPRAPRAPRAPA
jgi:lipopolysaccharide export system permease protein